MTWILLGLIGCMPASYVRAKALEGKYDVGSPGAGWEAVKPGGADKAWFNEGLGATIYTDSNCGPRFAESRVEDLATEVTAGVRDMTTDLEVYRSIGSREGIVRTHTGKLDGVPVRLSIAVVNRNACNYDFVYIGQIGKFDEGYAAFEAVMDGFVPR